MRVALRRFTAGDLPSLDRWRAEIDSDRFMERLSPVGFDNTGFEGWGLDYAWYVIEVDGSAVGGIWFDIKRTNKSIGVMGIVIGRVDSLGRGIGRRAIALAVPMARKVLGFDTVRLHVRKSNTRAISCYLNCGFTATGEGAKLLEDMGKVPFFRMEMYLKPAASMTAASLDRTRESVASIQRSAG